MSFHVYRYAQSGRGATFALPKTGFLPSPFPMRNPKLSGREIAVLRAIGFSEPIPGPELLESSQIAEEDMIDILNGLMDVGYVECTPIQPKATAETFSTTKFEVNPSYVQQIKELIIRRF